MLQVVRLECESCRWRESPFAMKLSAGYNALADTHRLRFNCPNYTSA
jgi:hypothetical protein